MNTKPQRISEHAVPHSVLLEGIRSGRYTNPRSADGRTLTWLDTAPRDNEGDSHPAFDDVADVATAEAGAVDFSPEPRVKFRISHSDELAALNGEGERPTHTFRLIQKVKSWWKGGSDV